MKKAAIYFIGLLICHSCNVQSKKSSEATVMIDSVVLPDVSHKPLPTIRDFIGKWKVTMETTESTCKNNQEGDIKQEIWTITKEDGKIKVKVTDNKETNDSYTGSYVNQQFLLKGIAYDLFYNGDVTVHGALIDENNFEGTREIIISTPCKIVYKITGAKKE